MKTMAEVITSHATHGLRDGKHVCHAPGCLWVYGRHGYPSPATVAEHVADALSAAGFGPVRETSVPSELKFLRGERKSLLKHIASWESQGHTSVSLAFLKLHLSKKQK